MWGEIEKHVSTESKAQAKLDAEYRKLKQNHVETYQTSSPHASGKAEHSRRILRCAYKLLLHNQAKRKRKHRAIFRQAPGSRRENRVRRSDQSAARR